MSQKKKKKTTKTCKKQLSAIKNNRIYKIMLNWRTNGRDQSNISKSSTILTGMANQNSED